MIYYCLFHPWPCVKGGLGVYLELYQVSHTLHHLLLQGPWTAFIVHREMVEREEEAIEDVLVKLFDERLLAKHWNTAVNAAHSFNKVVIINTADKVSHEALPHSGLHAGEDELEEVHNTAAELVGAWILENHIRTYSFQINCFPVLEDQVLFDTVSVGQHSKCIDLPVYHIHFFRSWTHEQPRIFAKI